MDRPDAAADQPDADAREPAGRRRSPQLARRRVGVPTVREPGRGPAGCGHRTHAGARTSLAAGRRAGQLDACRIVERPAALHQRADAVPRPAAAAARPQPDRRVPPQRSRRAGTGGRRQIVLHVGGAESVHAVYVNDRFVGYGTDSRLPSEYDITRHSCRGDNHLAIVVVRYSAHSYVEDQDQWWMAGLHRQVFVEARRLVAHRRRRAATADCDAATGTGSLTRGDDRVGFVRRTGRRVTRARDGSRPPAGAASAPRPSHARPAPARSAVRVPRVIASSPRGRRCRRATPWSAESPDAATACGSSCSAPDGAVVDTHVAAASGSGASRCATGRCSSTGSRSGSSASTGTTTTPIAARPSRSTTCAPTCVAMRAPQHQRRPHLALPERLRVLRPLRRARLLRRRRGEHREPRATTLASATTRGTAATWLDRGARMVQRDREPSVRSSCGASATRAATAATTTRSPGGSAQPIPVTTAALRGRAVPRGLGRRRPGQRATSCARCTRRSSAIAAVRRRSGTATAR